MTRHYGPQDPGIAVNDLFQADDGVTRVLPISPWERDGRRAAIRTIQQGRPMVYAVRMADGVVKIGCTTNLDNRLHQLKGELLAFRFGDFDDEKAIHRTLTDHLAYGREWFYPAPAVIAVVNEMREDIGLEPIAA